MVKNLLAMQESWVQSLGQEDALKKGMATHSSIVAWRIPWTEEPGGLQSMGTFHFALFYGYKRTPCILCRVLPLTFPMVKQVSFQISTHENTSLFKCKVYGETEFNAKEKQNIELFLHELTLLTEVSVTGNQDRILYTEHALFVFLLFGVTLTGLLQLHVRTFFRAFKS